MNQDALTVIIAESTRLGTHVLEKILEPYMDLRICRDDAALNQGLASPPAPRLCLISYLWPEVDVLLAQLQQHNPPIPAVLLASPDSDPATLAALSENFDCSILYRPYEPHQVIQEVLKQISRPLVSPPLTGLPVSEPEPEPVNPEPAEEPAPILAPVDILARDQAFCRRHHLPHSLMALRLQDMANLERELGTTICDQARQQLFAALADKLRREDGLFVTGANEIILTLPGTPPLGARVLAHRLCAWLQREEFRVDEFRIHFTIAAGIHCLSRESNESPEDALQAAQDAAAVAHASPHASAVHLSDVASEMAMHHVHQDEEAQQDHDAVDEADAPPAEEGSTMDPAQLWDTVAAILQRDDATASADTRAEVLERLTAMLRLLDENERMVLVDELLLASALP